ncbi:unnamed protein product [Microthlaspi erraticum]|uniref:F-box domain-containing protein n=1 Tax=Microthlaspi erraticum TaxID=1685480 RepID=A0A6D2L3U3_9BRAS|nr:unnamed protein product [Microthlaspi erraticum]
MSFSNILAMKKRRRNNLSTSKKEPRLTIPPVNGLRENSGSIPTDLLVEILSRVPAKSIARFRCVSKDWCSILRRPDFTNHFSTMSSARPRLLFTFQADGKWSFFSTPHSPDPDQNSSPLVVDSYTHVLSNSSFGVCRPVCGLVCSKDEGLLSGKRGPCLWICNPSVGLSKPLPNVRTRRSRIHTFTGYDPIEKTFKVLGMTSSAKPLLHKTEEHQVLTLGRGKPKWRKIACPVTHMPQYSSEICIDGVIYYLAEDEVSLDACMLVCFDVKSETFKFMINEELKDLGSSSTLIDYKGKVGVLCGPYSFLSARIKSIELWVIDDIEKQKWSRRVLILPPLWRDVLAGTAVCIMGMIGTSEVVFSPRFMSSSPFYIFYYNIEKKTFRRVEIQGIGPFKGQSVYSFINHVENVKPYEFLSST